MFREFHYRSPLMLAVRPQRPVHQRMRHMFNDMCHALSDHCAADDASQARMVVPHANVWETVSHYHIALDMPGVDAGSIDIEVRDDQLVICADRSAPQLDDDATVHLHEWSAAQYQRSFSIPSDMNAHQAEAQYSEGVLQLSVPKVAEAPATKIRVN